MMLDLTYELLINSKTVTELINSKLLVQHACHVCKFKMRNWNTYMKHVPSPSHTTLSFRPPVNAHWLGFISLQHVGPHVTKPTTRQPSYYPAYLAGKDQP
jgi:hypothetical protein